MTNRYESWKKGRKNIGKSVILQVPNQSYAQFSNKVPLNGEKDENNLTFKFETS